MKFTKPWIALLLTIILAVGTGAYIRTNQDVTFGTISGSTITATSKFSGAINGTVGTTTPAAGAFTTLDASGATILASTLAVTGNTTHTGTLTQTGAQTSAADYNLEDISSGGDAGARNTIEGLFKIKMVTLGVLSNGSNTINTAIDESPAGEWTATSNVTDSTDSTIFRHESNSLKLVFTTSAVAGNGADNPLGGGDEAWDAEESVGMWMYCNQVMTAGWVVLETVDATATNTWNFPAIAVANKWTWVEIDISGATANEVDVITDIGFDLSSAGATQTAISAITCYFDEMYIWSLADEEALGVNLVQDGVLSVMDAIDGQGSANKFTVMAEHTDYFVHYQSGNDAIVMIADESANAAIALVAYR